MVALKGFFRHVVKRLALQNTNVIVLQPFIMELRSLI